MASQTSIVVDRRPYLLAPDRPEEGEPRPMRDGETDTELSQAWQTRAGDLGLVMRRPQWSPNTTLVQEATLYAKSKGLDGDFHHRAARAYWEDGADLGDRTVVLGIARHCGLDENELAGALDAGDYRGQVLAEYEAAKQLGVRGTPTYQVESGEVTFGDLSAQDLLDLLANSGTN